MRLRELRCLESQWCGYLLLVGCQAAFGKHEIIAPLDERWTWLVLGLIGTNYKSYDMKIAL